MRRALCFTSILFLLACTLTSSAQTYRLKSYTTQSGLLSDHINDVAQNEDGTIWIATPKGISHYDGLRFYNYKDSAEQLPISVDTRLKIVSNNRAIIVGLNSTGNYVARYFIDSKWTNLSIPDSIDNKSRRTWDASQEGDQLLFKYVIKNTLYSYNSKDNAWTRLPLPDSLHNKYNKIVIKNGKAILLSELGVYTEQKDGWTHFIELDQESKFKNIVDIIFEPEGDTYYLLSSSGGLVMVQNGKVSYIEIKTKERNPRFKELEKSQNGFLFFRTSHTYFWYHLETQTQKSFYPIHDDIGTANSRFFIDKENGLWFTSYRGLHHIPGFQFNSLSTNSGLVGAEVTLIKEIAPAEYLIAYKNGYSVLKDDSIIFRGELPKSGKVNTRLISATTGPDNKIYIAGEDLGLGILQSNYKIKWLATDKRIVIAKNLKDTLWVMDYSGNLFFLKENTLIKKYALEDYPRSISLLNDGSLMVGTRNGIKIVSGATVKHLGKTSGLAAKEAYCSFTIKEKIYLGTEGGLSVLINDVLEKGYIQGIHIDRPIYSVIQTNQEIWFGTDNGVYRLRDSTLTNFNESDGLFGWEINRGAFIKDSKDQIVIGTNKGLNFYDPLHYEQKSLQFNPSIKSIRTSSEEYQVDKPIKLPPDKNAITIEIQAITFTGKPLEFRYRLLGFQEQWLPLSSRDVLEVVYRNLPPGTFTFEFQARIQNTKWCESITSSTVNIETPFQKTYAFYILLFAGAVALGFGIQWIISNQKISRKLQREIKEKVKDLIKSEAKLQIALENAKMGVWIYYFSTDQTEYSQELFTILDMPPEGDPLRKGNYLSRVHKDDHAKVIEEVNNAVISRTTYDLEVRVLLKDGTYRWLGIKGKATYNSKGEPEFLSGTMSDISTRKMYQAARENLISELEKTNQELDRFIYSVSHDLSAPIKSVQGLINLSRMEPLSPDLSNYLMLIERSITRQDEFIKEIIEYGRNARLPVVVEKIDVHEMINGIIEDIKYSTHFIGTEVTINIAHDERVIEGDRIRLKIILNNLLSNAFKYKSRSRDNHTVTISLTRQNALFNLSIQDSGIGIDQIHFEKLFSMFYRATDQEPGSGIGLYIAQEAAKKMDCSIEVSSTPGHGSTFTLKQESSV